MSLATGEAGLAHSTHRRAVGCKRVLELSDGSRISPPLLSPLLENAPHGAIFFYGAII